LEFSTEIVVVEGAGLSAMETPCDADVDVEEPPPQATKKEIAASKVKARIRLTTTDGLLNVFV
jgi:hypothetical protein